MMPRSLRLMVKEGEVRNPDRRLLSKRISPLLVVLQPDQGIATREAVTALAGIRAAEALVTRHALRPPCTVVV